MMTISRRSFLESVGATAVVGSLSPLALGAEAGVPRLRFGVLSDIHFYQPRLAEYIDGGCRFMESEARVRQLFGRALSYFDGKGCDAVVIAGDMADGGLVNDLLNVRREWERQFPADKSKIDGRKVERFFIYGNHDLEGFGYSYMTKRLAGRKLPAEELISADPAAAWQKAFDEPYRPIWMKRVKGYAFVGSHWKGPSGDHEIGDFLSQQGDALKGDRPFFYVQHPTPAKTCCGEKAWGQDDGCSTQALSVYPNAVAISGHCHLSLTDERNVWQGAFTSIGASALWQVALDSGRENSFGVKDSVMKGRRGDQDGIVTSHVQFVSVYDNHIRIERFDIRNNLSLGEDWILQTPVTAETALTDAKRSRLSTPPGPFPDGAEICLEVLSDRIRLEFPAVCVTAGASSVKDYVIEAWQGEGASRKLVFSKDVFGPGAFFAAEREKGPIVAEFSRSLFSESRQVRFAVYAREAFGKRNEGLSQEFLIDL